MSKYYGNTEVRIIDENNFLKTRRRWKKLNQNEAKLSFMAEFFLQSTDHSYATLTPTTEKSWKLVDCFLKATIILILKPN